MRVLYIGQYEQGSTSRMRGENLKSILKPAVFEVIDINEPIYTTNRFIRSLGWRWHKGPLVGKVMKFIEKKVDGHYDLLWVDKGVFIGPELVDMIDAKVKAHYTPDTAVVFNKSDYFFRSIPRYDYCITTKSFEMGAYEQKGARNILFCTQGYDPRFHRPYLPFEEKKGVVFVGHCEEAREQVLSRLLEKRIRVTLAGPHWDKFAAKHRNDVLLSYVGKGVYGAEYGRLLSGALVGLGLLSRWFPERHTTRTLEIPACGTALLTERNGDTTGIFREDEVIFYENEKELLDRVDAALRDQAALRQLTQKGYERVTRGEFDYNSILQALLRRMGVAQ